MNKPIAGPNGAPATKWEKKGDYCLVNMWRYRIVYKLEYGETVSNVACVAGAKRGGGGRKARKRGKGIPLPFSLSPYPLPLSTPATQAIPNVAPAIHLFISYAANEHKCILSLSSCIRAYKAVTEGPFAVILHQEINFTVVKIIIFRGDCA